VAESIEIKPIGWVRNARREVVDDDWGGVESEIEMVSSLGEAAIAGIESFSHIEVIFYFHQVAEGAIVSGARHPRNNPDWPLVGIFAQRGKNRPNRLGLAVARVIARRGAVLTVRDLDAIDGTPILDIKPVMREFLPVGEVSQPEWATELMRHYWRQG
jgi:tRNA-Thr(GGU) m(6)t(6)A37 methyltransferase TsaA